MAERDEFQPDWVSAPGDTIADILEERNLSATEFAERMGYTPEHTNELLQGRATITVETAQRLESVLGSSTAFWMIRESQYREDLTRLQHEVRAAGVEDWLSELPVKDMLKFGWIESTTPSINDIAACL